MKSLLYTVLNTATATTLNDVVPLGSVDRKYGRNITLNGNKITLNRAGYYEVNVSSVFTASAAGNVALELTNNNVGIDGATGIETITTADTEYRSIDFQSVVRVFCCVPITLQIVTNGTAAPTIQNLAITVKEL